MNLICCFFDKGTVQLRQLDCPRITNLRNLINYLEEMQPELWSLLRSKQITFGISSSLDAKPSIWLGAGDFVSLDNVEYIFIVEKIEGEAIFTAIATAVASAAFAAGVGGTIAGVGVAALIGELVATIAVAALTAGISMAVGAIMQALSPSHQSPKDKNGQSSVFSQSLNTDEEGSPVPFCLGESLGGGIIIGKLIHTYDLPDILIDYTPPLPADVQSIYKSNLHNAAEGVWYKILVG